MVSDGPSDEYRINAAVAVDVTSKTKKRSKFGCGRIMARHAAFFSRGDCYRCNGKAAALNVQDGFSLNALISRQLQLGQLVGAFACA